MPRVVNVISDEGKAILAQELKKTIVWFDELK
jgi:hypothetical protein